MSSRDAAPDEPAELTVRCQDDRAVSVKFCDLFDEDEDCAHYAIEACAAGLNVRLDGVGAWNWSADLAPFLEKLSEDFRGWEGERVWQTNDRDLTVRAVFRSGGHVGLTWTLRPGRVARPSGKLENTVSIDARLMASITGSVNKGLTTALRRLSSFSTGAVRGRVSEVLFQIGQQRERAGGNGGHHQSQAVVGDGPVGQRVLDGRPFDLGIIAFTDLGRPGVAGVQGRERADAGFAQLRGVGAAYVCGRDSGQRHCNRQPQSCLLLNDRLSKDRFGFFDSQSLTLQSGGGRDERVPLQGA
ncbi:DUF6228 family protein, partial [Streptomyces sp. JAC18]